MRAQVTEFKKIERLFCEHEVKQENIEESLQEALENIVDLKENPNEIEHAI